MDLTSLGNFISNVGLPVALVVALISMLFYGSRTIILWIKPYLVKMFDEHFALIDCVKKDLAIDRDSQVKNVEIQTKGIEMQTKSIETQTQSIELQKKTVELINGLYVSIAANVCKADNEDMFCRIDGRLSSIERKMTKLEDVASREKK